MKELCLPPELSQEITEIYATMATSYDQVARSISLTCQGCPDICCDSYFQHYTYVEWAYLWEGLRLVDDDKLDRILERARHYLTEANTSIARGHIPSAMCPLNEDGRCGLYEYRLMICRMHGVPAVLTRPDNQILHFPGCFRCQEIVAQRFVSTVEAPTMDRTILYQRLAQLESRLLGEKRRNFPKVKLTIAEMIISGPPRVSKALLAEPPSAPFPSTQAGQQSQP
jgi:hypothetical protein